MADYPDRTIAGRALLAAVVASALNAAVVWLARTADLAPGFRPLSYPPTVFLTVLGTGAAAFVFAAVVRLSVRPRWVFERVAAIGLVVSILPDLLLLRVEPTATVAGVLALVAMHVLAAVVIVGLLTRGLGRLSRA